MKFYILSIFIIAYAKLSQSFHRTIFKTSLSVNRATTLNTDTKTITTRNKLIDPVDEILLEEAKHLEPKDSFDPLRLSNIRKALPSSVFEKSLFKSVRYMLQDYAVIFASFIAIWTLTHSGLWVTLPVVAKALASLAYWNVCGFYMWCIFVVGHDCGHGSFSNNRLVNDILGHIAHGSILVPFYPWQLSHRKHHQFHNHVDKDYSHPWYTPDKKEELKGTVADLLDVSIVRALVPFISWPLYTIYGMPDGSHFIPDEKKRLWAESPEYERKKCWISTAVVALFGSSIFVALGSSVSAFLYYYLAPVLVFGWWLMAVTYLQHHADDTLVYSDKDWKYVDAAFETVDRKYGLGIDALHHHISDGHVVHHLFFTQIPHYHLAEATEGLKKYLKEHNLYHLYKLVDTKDFPVRLHKDFYNKRFDGVLAKGPLDKTPRIA